MVFHYDLAQTRPHYVCIDLGRADIRMAQHHLHTAQVRASFEQMRRECVPQHVRTQLSVDPGSLSMCAQQLPEALARHTRSPRGHEQVWTYSPLQQQRTLLNPILLNCLQRLAAHRHNPLLVTLADDSDCPFKLICIGYT